MKKIQIVNYWGKSTISSGGNITVSKLSEPQSFDSFDINIIDLDVSNLWYNNENSLNRINSIMDFKNIGTMIGASAKTKFIVAMPQNYTYYHYKIGNDYCYSKALKNMPKELCKIISHIFDKISKIELIYENTVTNIDNTMIPATFFFNNILEEHVLTKSDISDKATTVSFYGLVLTTLKLSDMSEIDAFLEQIGYKEPKEAVPEWLKNINMFDDEAQLRAIEESNRIIAEEKENIKTAGKVIDKNNRYKSILYTQSSELVEVVFEILEEMLGFDLCNFKDEKGEDYLCEKGNSIYLGEIKGVTSNVRNEYVSQLEVHYQTYIEDNTIDEENVKAWLIINHQRKKPVDLREPIHEKQIKLAERNGSLIIDTYVLLKLFERFKAGDIDDKQCLQFLSGRVGIVRVDDVNDIK